MTNQAAPYPPPQLPVGWHAVWDTNAQRYYFVETASGRTQWEQPTAAASAMPEPKGEANSFATNFASASHDAPPAYPVASSNPAGATEGSSAGQERGLGSLISGLMGKPHHGQSSGHGSSSLPMALAGSVAGMAASKLFGKNHHQQSGGYHQGAPQGYYAQPPQPQPPAGGYYNGHQAGGYGYAPPAQYGYGGHQEHGHHAPHAHHAHHGHQEHGGNHAYGGHHGHGGNHGHGGYHGHGGQHGHGGHHGGW